MIKINKEILILPLCLFLTNCEVDNYTEAVTQEQAQGTQGIRIHRKAPPEDHSCSRRNLSKGLVLIHKDAHHDNSNYNDIGKEESSLNSGVELRIDLQPIELRVEAREENKSRKTVVNSDIFRNWGAMDFDNDCLSNSEELALGTSIFNADTDGDGWFDGPCNKRKRLILTRIKAHDEQEDSGKDEFYLIVDDIRHPHDDLNDYWLFNDGDSKTFSRVIAERTRGTNTNNLRNVTIQGWEDDPQVTNTWAVDDQLFSFTVNLNNYNDGDTFSRRLTYSDWDYQIYLEVDVQKFADPSPINALGDEDEDGILDEDEFRVAKAFGGITDPYSQDILVEVDAMPGNGFRTEAKRLVNTRLHLNGYDPYIIRQEELPFDGCITRTEAKNLYLNYFTYAGYNAFRYAVVTELLWNDASGVAIGDFFAMDNSTWWINDGILAQAGTFIHELGHTLSLTNDLFHLIDTTAGFSYDSAMNYLFQPSLVDFSDDGAGGSSNDHNDWADVDPAYGLGWSFGESTRANQGICD